jgi:hypothetical protein
LDDAPMYFGRSVARRGRTSNPGLRRAVLFRLSYRNVLLKWFRQESNLQHPESESGASAELGY